jgi:hypothetical protein
VVPSCGLVYLWLQCSSFCNAIISDLLGRIGDVPRASSWRTMSRHQPRCVSVTALVICRHLSLPVPQHLPYCRKIRILRSSKIHAAFRPRSTLRASHSRRAARRAGRLQAAVHVDGRAGDERRGIARRKSNTEAISSGSPGRPSALALAPSVAASGTRAPIAVLIRPGAIAFTRMKCRPSRVPRFLVR